MIVVVAGRGRVARACGFNQRGVVRVIVIRLMHVMSEISRLTLCVLEHIAKADYRCVGGVEGEKQGEKKSEANAHGQR